MKKKQNNYAFIDSQNLNLAIRDQGWRLDNTRFRIFLKENYGVEKAFLFLGYIPENKPLYCALKKADFILIFKPIISQIGKGNFVKGNVDAELVLHTMIEYHNYDKAIIISGDGDFYCLVKYLFEKGKLLRLGIPNKQKYSALLRTFRSCIFYMNEVKEKLEYKKR